MEQSESDESFNDESEFDEETSDNSSNDASEFGELSAIAFCAADNRMAVARGGGNPKLERCHEGDSVGDFDVASDCLFHSV